MSDAAAAGTSQGGPVDKMSACQRDVKGESDHYAAQMKELLSQPGLVDNFLRSQPGSVIDPVSNSMSFPLPENVRIDVPYKAKGRFFSASDLVNLSIGKIFTGAVRLLLFLLMLCKSFPAHFSFTLSKRKSFYQNRKDPGMPAYIGDTFFTQPPAPGRTGNKPHPINGRFRWGCVFFCNHQRAAGDSGQR